MLTGLCVKQVQDMVKRTAAGLAAWGVKPKDVVLLLSPNLPEFPIAYLAVVYLGAVVAPSNPLNTNADIAKQVAQAGVKFVVTVPELLSKFGDECDLPTILIGKLQPHAHINVHPHILHLACWVPGFSFLPFDQYLILHQQQ